MKKRYLYVFLPLLVFVLAGTSYAWQGRMGGMGDPFGLVQDESDYLIHPAKIANGQGTRLYGGYRFTFRGVDDLGYDVDLFPPVGPLAVSSRYFTDGDRQTHDIFTGIAFPAGPGRLGIFADYRLARGGFDGTVAANTISPTTNSDELKDQLDEFALRLLYGLPIGGGFKLGAEAQLAYRAEKNETEITKPLAGDFFINSIHGTFGNPFDLDMNLYPFMIPYDSSYMEALFKGSVEGTVGPVAAALTMRGGFLFGGKNEFSHIDVGLFNGHLDMNGDVQGWQLGGDLWLRYPLASDLAIPFLVRFDYREKTRDGDGVGFPGALPAWNYTNKEKSFDIETGGGVDVTLAKGTKAAAGLYYNYVTAATNFELMSPLLNWTWDRSNNPECIEHRILVRLAGEHALTPAIDLQVGLNGFYSWVKENYDFTQGGFFNGSENVSLNGHRWGIGGSLGAVVRVFHGFAIEPFVNGGYQETTLDGDGLTTFLPGFRIEMDKTTREWLVGGGLSILLDL